MGLRPGSRTIEIAQSDVTHEPVPVDEAAWIERTLRLNPTVAASRSLVERDRHLMKVAGNARLPQLDFTIGWSRFNDPDFNEARKIDNLLQIADGDSINELRTTGFDGWTGSVLLTVPLGNKILGNQYRNAKLVYQQSLRLQDEIENRTVLEMRTAIRALANNVERLEILSKSIEGARDKLEYANVNFQLGRASNLDVTDAQKDLVDAETDYINEVIDYRIQLARIEQLVGGFD
jgi:outer membrane protein TolC